MRCTALLFCLSLSSVGAAQLPVISPGALVRVEVLETHKKLTGTLMAQEADSLTIAAPGATTVQTTSIKRIRLSEGRSRGRGAIHGAKIGAVVVGGGFALLFIGAYALSSEPNKSGLAPWVGVALVVGGIEGALIGGIIGAARGGEKWSTIYTNPAGSKGSVGTSRATGMGLSLAF